MHRGMKYGFRLIVVGDADDLGKVAALIVAKELRDNPRAVLALPTGRTPLGMYRQLRHLYEEGEVDFAGVTTFNLDEFYGIPAEHPGSFAAYMRRELFDRVNLHPENINLLDSLASAPSVRGLGGHPQEFPFPKRAGGAQNQKRCPGRAAPDADEECHGYERKIRRAGGIDLAILGIGHNGHIAFNEPGSPFDARTRLVKLTERTLADNSIYFADATAVPRFALTMGIGTIMEARRILLLASDGKKARILARALEGDITSDVPASALQRHSGLTVVADEPAVASLRQLTLTSR
ncbi:MAG: glucosamine-6-phosphate deaminase [Chloroflexi bacterium]|nr:glucosamine-6-phosphate deaminase [Chloroflexota bacterium]